MKRTHETPAFFHTETEIMLEILKKKGMVVSSCYVCGTPIVKTERKPIYLKEKWDSWRHKKKFYDWNISGVSNQGVICESLRCLWDANHQMADIATKVDKK